MNPQRKSLIIVIVVVALAGMGLFVQYWAARGRGPIHVTAAELEQMIPMLPEARRQSLKSEQGKQEFADEVKQTLALGQEARRLGIVSRPDVAFMDTLTRHFLLGQIYRQRHGDVELTDKEIADFYASNPTSADELVKYNPQLGPRGGPLDDRVRRQYAEIEIFVARARTERLDQGPGVAVKLDALDTYLRDVMLRELQSSIRVSDEEVRRYYEEHKSQYEQVRARHILFSTRPTSAASASTEEAAKEGKAPDKEVVRKMAQDVLRRIRAGEDFATLARQYSEDPGSKDRGGDLQYFGRGQMVSEFERVAFELPPGQTSDLVESTYGFHIIRVEDHRVQPLDGSLRANAANILKQQLLAARTKEIGRRYPVTVDIPSGNKSGS